MFSLPELPELPSIPYAPYSYIAIVLLLTVLLWWLWRLWRFYFKKDKTFNTTSDYPVVKILEDNWQTIANEIPQIDVAKLDEYPRRSRSAWNNAEAADLLKTIKSEWCQGWQGERVWYNFPLMYHGHVIDKAEQMCPQTIALLKQLPQIQIAGYSTLMPGKALTPHSDHTGKAFGSMACNLMLSSNPKGSLYVNGKEYNHTSGKAVIFDATQEHWADNRDTHNPRTILYIDFKTT